jgi:hypothetical protein
MPLLFERLLEKSYNLMIIKEKLYPEEESDRAGKFHRNHGLIVVGLFELPANLPSDYMRWCDICRYQMLSVDSLAFPRDFPA